MAPRTGPDAHDGIPLRQLKGPGADVELSCRGCQHRRILPLQKVIDRLVAKRLGGAETGVRAVARHVDRPCPRCGGRFFESRPAYPGSPEVPTGARTPFAGHP